MNTLFVYPTSRKILSKLILSDNIVIDKSITIDEFLKKSTFIPNKIKLNKESRVIFLKEAITKVDKDIGLGSEFRKNFLFFLKNSSFIFKFFDEIFAEKSSLEEIEIHDFQGEFIDHLEALKEVYYSYKDILQRQNFYDSSTFEKYEINQNFLREYDEVELVLEGYLSKKEFEIIFECSKIIPLKIRLYSTLFNKKMFQYFKTDLKTNVEYLFDLSNDSIVEQTPINANTIFEVSSFDSRISQCAFVAKKIHDFIEIDKFKSENIAVVIPDENFALTLKQMDFLNNLNFAMGISFSQSLFYKKLHALYESLLDFDIQSIKRIKQFDLDDLRGVIKSNKDKNGFLLLEDIIYTLVKDCDEDVQYIISEVVHFLQNLKEELCELSFMELLSYFLHLVKNKSIPHKSGGMIKVIGILESRNISFDGVIIVDFNDDIIPQISQKDIFLNSQIRKLSSIPTKLDRENLQKYYYKRLFDNSKKVSIGYVLSDEKIASKFLTSFKIDTPKQNTNYNDLFFSELSTLSHIYKKPFVHINTDKNISSSRLNTFIECKQKFYNKYVLKLKLENTASLEMSRLTYGSIIHDILKNIKTTKDVDNLKVDIKKTALKYKNGTDNHLSFEISKFASSINGFIQELKDNFSNGYRVLFNERDFNVLYNSFTLIGKIDKVETLHNDNGQEVHIVDYKIKKPSTSIADKLQLYIYYLAIKKDFNNATIIAYNHYLPSNEKKYIKLETMKDEFDEYLKEYESEFLVQKCENKSICRYCPYSLMCNRG